MGETEYNLFMEYKKNRESFLKWLGKISEEIDLDDLL
jgi:hypothetical protein